MPLGVLMKMLMLMLSGLCSNRGKWCWEGSPNPPLTIKLDTQRVLQAQCQKRLFVFKIIVRRAYSSKIFPHKLQKILCLSASANTFIQYSIVKLKKTLLNFVNRPSLIARLNLFAFGFYLLAPTGALIVILCLYRHIWLTFWDFEHFCQYILSYDFLSYSMMY